MKRAEGTGARLRDLAAAVAMLAVLMPGPASAQQSRWGMPGAQQFAPSGGAGAITPGQTLIPQALVPQATSPAIAQGGPPLAAPSAAIPAGQVGLVVSARYGRDFVQPINSNLVWRGDPRRAGQRGAVPPPHTKKTAAPPLVLAPPGSAWLVPR